MTLSMVARCARTGQFGVVIASSSPAVAARCAHVRAGVGAVATQNVTDPALGPLVLDALGRGRSATAVLAALDRPHLEWRQLAAIGPDGSAAIRTGARVLGTWGEALGPGCAAAGNLLAVPEVPRAMVAGFGEDGALGDRLMAALAAGMAAGGEAGPVRSAGLLIADRLSWPMVDLRVDWSDDPLADLAGAWAVYGPQAAAYVARAENPASAPSYNVPGDL